MIQVGDYILHDYQERAVERLRDAILKLSPSDRRVVLLSPTGSGKTIMALGLIQLAVERGKTVGFITSGRELIHQMHRTLDKAGIAHGVYMDGYEFWPEAVNVISKDTYVSRKERWGELKYDLWIVDEVDVSISSVWCDLLTETSSGAIVGLTATAARGNGKGLGPFYKDIVKAATYDDLIARGFIVPVRCYSPYRPDLAGATVSGADYNQKWLQTRMDRSELVGDVYQWWTKLGEDSPTVVFCCGVEHSIHVAQEFNGQGVPAEHVDGTTSTDERAAIFDRVRNGQTKVLTNCAVIDRGFDLPALRVCVLAKPTKRLRTYIQMVGRVLRAYPGKQDAILIDHSGAVWNHGWPTDDRDWNLDPDETVEVREEKNRQEEKTPREPYCCPMCACMWEKGITCPNCGYRHRRRGLAARTVDGKLVEVKRKRLKAKDHHENESQKYWMQCLARMAHTGRSYAAASTVFRQRTGKWPEDAGVGPVAKPEQRRVPVAAIWPGFVRKKKTA